MLTLNQHIKLFSDFATNHQVLNSFDFGDAWEWMNSLKQEDDRLIYPAMFVAPVNTNITEYKCTRTYTLYICIRERKAEENEDDGLSDCEKIALEFLTYMYKGLNDTAVSISKSITLEPHTEFGMDYVVAYSGDFSIVENIEYNDCVIPII